MICFSLLPICFANYACLCVMLVYTLLIYLEHCIMFILMHVSALNVVIDNTLHGQSLATISTSLFITTHPHTYVC